MTASRRVLALAMIQAKIFQRNLFCDVMVAYWKHVGCLFYGTPSVQPKRRSRTPWWLCKVTFFHRKLLLKHDGRGKVKHGVGNFFWEEKKPFLYLLTWQTRPWVIMADARTCNVILLINRPILKESVLSLYHLHCHWMLGVSDEIWVPSIWPLAASGHWRRANVKSTWKEPSEAEVSEN